MRVNDVADTVAGGVNGRPSHPLAVCIKSDDFGAADGTCDGVDPSPRADVKQALAWTGLDSRCITARSM